MAHIHSNNAPSAVADKALQCLSKRQREIAERYVRGLTYKQIAAELYIAPTTVRNHLATIYRELGIANKADLIRFMSTAAVSESAEDADMTAEPHAETLSGPSHVSGDETLNMWLKTLSLEQYADIFAANAIGWKRYWRYARTPLCYVQKFWPERCSACTPSATRQE